MSNELIEAMADSIEAQLRSEDGWYVGTPELRGMCVDFATAAYSALREKLVPVGWKYTSPEGTVRRWMASQLDHGRPDYWTEQPLYHLPEPRHD